MSPADPQQSERESVQFHATASDQDTTAHQQSEDSNHLESARASDEVRADATTCEKAGDGIRTLDVQLGNLATHFASTSKYSTSERGKSNPSAYPSSQAQETRVSEPYLTSIEQGVGELDDKKLPDLLELKYHSSADAVAKMGSANAIREVFIGFQQHLYGGTVA